ncbi:protoheme IX farnesyltransferase [Phlyctema vagabunda]|uniref:Protoheme IX farnesyltransferase, mitochondrial n=1 Tax=Phlyctema vagabunda TaxID=108571 RepID=A0ABR4PQK8_9HELO
MIIRSTPARVFASHGLSTICHACLYQTSTRAVTRAFSQSSNLKTVIAGAANTAPRLRAGYFSANALLEKARAGARRGAITTTVATLELDGEREENDNVRATKTSPKAASKPTSTNIQANTEELPHRKRQREKREAAANAPDLVLPQNASDTLTSQASSAPPSSFRRIASSCLALSKPRLTVLVVLTAMAPYSLYPVAEILSPSLTDTPSLSTLTLFFLSTGTLLCSASANALNMLYEPKWDALMSRTKNRPLVRGLISRRGAALYAVASAMVGTALLYYGVNPTVAFLGGLNIALYAGVYTPLKRISVLNTWVGAIVGGIPPLMGWAAAAGQSAREGDWRELLFGEQSIGGWILASILVSWQFSHFMALSWSIRDEYKNAGYRMLCWVNPARNGRVAFRYSLTFLPLCIALCYVGVTEWTFAVASTPLNLWLVKEAFQFWRFEGHKGTARGLFWCSVWHLPALLVLAMVEKKGMWQRVWRAAFGVGELDLEDEDEWEEVDEEDERVKLPIPSR